MASKNETDKPSTKQSTIKTSPRRTQVASPSTSRNPESDIHDKDTNKNNDNTCQQAQNKGKKREAGKKTEDKALKSRIMLENELTEKSQRVDSLEVQLKGLQEKLKAEQAQKKINKELYEETKAALTKAHEELRDFGGKYHYTYSNLVYCHLSKYRLVPGQNTRSMPNFCIGPINIMCAFTNRPFLQTVIKLHVLYKDTQLF